MSHIYTPLHLTFSGIILYNTNIIRAERRWRIMKIGLAGICLIFLAILILGFVALDRMHRD